MSYRDLTFAEECVKLVGTPPSFGIYDRQSINRAIVRLEEKNAEKEFVKLYKEIRDLYRLLLEGRLEVKEKFS